MEGSFISGSEEGIELVPWWVDNVETGPGALDLIPVFRTVGPIKNKTESDCDNSTLYSAFPLALIVSVLTFKFPIFKEILFIGLL